MKTISFILLCVFLSLQTMAQWTDVYTSSTVQPRDICFVADNNWQTGFVSSYDGDLLKTTDGGTTWTASTLPATAVGGICFIDANLGFFCTFSSGGGKIYKTVDGGTTWTEVYAHPQGWGLDKLAFKDNMNGVAIGSEHHVYTSDGGDTWQNGASASMDYWEIDYAGGDTYFAVSLFPGPTGHNVGKSTDGGVNIPGIANEAGMAGTVSFYDENSGVVAGDPGNISVTQDGGTTWTSTSFGSGPMSGSCCFDADTMYVGGVIYTYKTTDGGTNWNIDRNEPNKEVRGMFATPNNVIYACGFGYPIGNDGFISRFIGAPPFAASFTADDTTKCVGGQVQFTDNSSGAITTWSWTFEGGTPATSSNQNPLITYNTAGVYDVTLIITNGVDYDTLVRSDYIYIDDIPAQANTPSGETETCETATYNYTTNSVTYASSYDWVVDPASAGTISGSDTNASFTAASGWTGAYTVKVRATNECGDGTWSSLLNCNVNHMPIVQQLSGGGSYCEGGSGVEILLHGSETGVDYELYLEGLTTGNILTGTGDTISFGMITDVGLYTAIGYTATCTEDMMGQLYVSVEELPEQASTPSGPESICNYDTASYSTSGASGATSYGWDLEPDSAGTLTTNGGTYADVIWSPVFAGTAQIMLWGINDCGDGPVSEVFETEVYATPEPLISGLDWVCVNEEAVYNVDENSGSTYSWEVVGGEITEGAGTAEITVLWGATAGPGSVDLTEESEFGCIAAATQLEVIIDECTGIYNNEVTKYAIYPNPATDQLIIESSTSESRTYNLLSPAGGLVYSAKTSGEKCIINLRGIQKGFYILQIIDINGSISNHRVVIN